MTTDTHATRAQPTAADGWLAEWIQFGLREFETYLGKHSRFDEYYDRRERCAPTSPGGRHEQ